MAALSYLRSVQLTPLMWMLPRDFVERVRPQVKDVEVVDGGKRRASKNTGRIAFIAIDGALPPKELQHHHEGGLYKSHNKRHRGFTIMN
jgi:hypothetical protein